MKQTLAGGRVLVAVELWQTLNPAASAKAASAILISARSDHDPGFSDVVCDLDGDDGSSSIAALDTSSCGQ
ncbi:hypothetical protein [Roseomonas xinghualingensis]|uniref:hypothetical protein n=1 Tax=Roseomonas xinghualingensis TaxID=2986475 RepID=UPI0021F0A865|nr:hypothetical protein [Roseomonas sp. SXEYE001]MCV4208682.1 hypothetical protein [Roseomonas sp. SXEYE001]